MRQLRARSGGSVPVGASQAGFNGINNALVLAHGAMPDGLSQRSGGAEEVYFSRKL